MVNERTRLIEELNETIDQMISSIEDYETLDPDFAQVRDVAEQLREEIKSLQDT